MGMYYERKLYNLINYLKVLIFLECDIFCFTSKKWKEVSFFLNNSQHTKNRKEKKKKKKKKKKKRIRERRRERRKNGRQER